MCGRAILTSPVEDVAELFAAEPIDIGPPRFNIAPSQPILTVRAAEEAERRELRMVRWGLIPWWAKPEEAKKLGSRFVQARAETARKTPAFRDAFARHRCLVVVDGFYEWTTLPDGRRVPHLVRLGRGEPFAIAGLWDSWKPPTPDDGEAPARLESCAVLTTPSAGPIEALHDRMPLVLPANEWNTWLGGSADEAAELLSRDRDELARQLVATPVSTWVNSVQHDDPRCIEPAAAVPVLGQVDFEFPAARPARK